MNPHSFQPSTPATGPARGTGMPNRFADRQIGAWRLTLKQQKLVSLPHLPWAYSHSSYYAHGP